ncbi:M20 aminoacylase family protein [Neoroseomonas lacus]|uniref:Hydrolase n=1 Tax=Neoroseomonas lacus TaxID=287609 RepID=A0A917KSK2_9PROT|nr:M20 aminoacylase family protein [Neoroseomonas lacus]GGJ25875.1 hydrolase [Neoroseomonas lacus]
MPIINRIADFHPELTATRRDIHAHPELGFQEQRTSEMVAQQLQAWGIEVHRGIAGTGLVGVLRNGSSGRSIGFRADMDCLPMEETNDFTYRSTNAGKMHACGHDGHTTMLLGAARYLAETKNFDGTVHFIFQPAEEGGGGGRVMVEEGLFDRFPCDAVYGMHNTPELPLGEARIVAGPVLAAADRINITVHGKGGHASRPQSCIDPVLVGAHIVVAVQSIVSRSMDPLDSAVISICQFHAGSAGNVIPEVAELNGTVRTFKPEVQDMVEARLHQIVRATAEAHGTRAELSFQRGYPPTVNHAAQTERAALAAAAVLGEAKVLRHAPPRMGAEDFSYMLLARPGCFIGIGQGDGGRHSVSLHNPRYDFNDDLIPLGSSLFARLAEQEMPR